jgi:NAD(P)-dependent dehydrogenase (short-subunit alcohol dehydrogenase family)
MTDRSVSIIDIARMLEEGSPSRRRVVERFQDRRIIVTGGGSGIGRATVLRLLREAGTVHAVDVDEPGLVGTAELADAEGIGHDLTTGVLDISDEAAVDAGVRATVERLGGLDVLVNAAGILRAANTHECTLDMWNQVIGVNLTGTFLMCRAAIPALLESDHAAIVNFSSTSATFGHPYMAAYAASKGGIDAMTHTLAMEYAKRGIRVTAVAPGSIQSGITETTGGMLPAETDWGLFAKITPLLGEGFAPPEVVASVIAMLASDDGAFVTGTSVRIDGGTHA